MQFRCMERGERVDRFDGLRLYVPFEEPQHYRVGGEIGEDEAMLLDRLQLLLEIEHCRSVAGVPRMPVEGQPPGRVPIVPGSAMLTGFLRMSSVPLRCIVPRAIACMSPLTTSGTRPFMDEIAAISLSCCLSQPDCQ